MTQDQDGRIVDALAESSGWREDAILEFKLRAGVRFQNGATFSAEHIKINDGPVQQWPAPHSPGTKLNLPPESVPEVVDELTLRFHFPGPDGLAIGKMRGFHITSKCQRPGFGYQKFGSGDGPAPG